MTCLKLGYRSCASLVSDTVCNLNDECARAGGASCTVSSLQAGLWGAAAGVPLVAMRELLWMPEAHRRFPVFHDVTETYSRNLAPLVKNMTSQQVRAPPCRFRASALLGQRQRCCRVPWYPPAHRRGLSCSAAASLSAQTQLFAAEQNPAAVCSRHNHCRKTRSTAGSVCRSRQSASWVYTGICPARHLRSTRAARAGLHRAASTLADVHPYCRHAAYTARTFDGALWPR